MDEKEANTTKATDAQTAARSPITRLPFSARLGGRSGLISYNDFSRKACEVLWGKLGSPIVQYDDEGERCPWPIVENFKNGIGGRREKRREFPQVGSEIKIKQLARSQQQSTMARCVGITTTLRPEFASSASQPHKEMEASL